MEQFAGKVALVTGASRGIGQAVALQLLGLGATVIGCGGMARHHIRRMLQQDDTTTIAVICEPSAEAYAATAEIYAEAGMAPPPNEPDAWWSAASSSAMETGCTTPP